MLAVKWRGWFDPINTSASMLIVKWLDSFYLFWHICSFIRFLVSPSFTPSVFIVVVLLISTDH